MRIAIRRLELPHETAPRSFVWVARDVEKLRVFDAFVKDQVGSYEARPFDAVE